MNCEFIPEVQMQCAGVVVAPRCCTARSANPKKESENGAQIPRESGIRNGFGFDFGFGVGFGVGCGVGCASCGVGCASDQSSERSSRTWGFAGTCHCTARLMRICFLRFLSHEMSGKQPSHAQRGQLAARLARVVAPVPAMDEQNVEAIATRVCEILRREGADQQAKPAGRTIVLSRDMAESVAADFMSHDGVSLVSLLHLLSNLAIGMRDSLSHAHKYYAADPEKLQKIYVKATPHLLDLPALHQRVLGAMRNARSHLASYIKPSLTRALPHQRADDGTMTVGVLFW